MDMWTIFGCLLVWYSAFAALVCVRAPVMFEREKSFCSANQSFAGI